MIMEQTLFGQIKVRSLSKRRDLKTTLIDSSVREKEGRYPRCRSSGTECGGEGLCKVQEQTALVDRSSGPFFLLAVCWSDGGVACEVGSLFVSRADGGDGNVWRDRVCGHKAYKGSRCAWDPQGVCCKGRRRKRRSAGGREGGGAVKEEREKWRCNSRKVERKQKTS